MTDCGHLFWLTQYLIDHFEQHTTYLFTITSLPYSSEV